MQHLSIFSGTRLKKRKDEQHLAERSANKTSKTAKRRHTEVPGNRARTARPNYEEPTEPDHQPRATWHDRATCWRGRFGSADVLSARQCFGTVTPCLWARPCHPRSATRLKTSPGAVLTTFSFQFDSAFIQFFVSQNALRRFLGFNR